MEAGFVISLWQDIPEFYIDNRASVPAAIDTLDLTETIGAEGIWSKRIDPPSVSDCEVWRG